MFEVPQAINWSYTYRCNFNCSHCYSRAPDYPEELSEEIYATFVDRLIDAQIFSVGFGGGEPLVRRDFLDTVAKLSLAGIETHFTSNGWLLDADRAARLREAGLGMIAISLDSAKEDAHDHLRNRKGSFRRALAALSLMRGGATHVTVSCTVHRGNVHEIHDLVKLCLASGANEVNLKVFRPAGNGLVLRQDMALSSDEVETLQAAAADLNAQHPGQVTFFGPESHEGCSCGVSTLTLRPNGDLAICPYGDIILGNLQHDDIPTIWTRHPLLMQRRSHLDECVGRSDNQWPLGRKVTPAAEQRYVARVRDRWHSAAVS